MNMFALLAFMALTAFVIVSCICRVNLLRPGKHAYIWTIKYALFTAFAGGEFLEAAQSATWSTWYELAGLTGVVVHLLVTRKAWRNGPPRIAEIIKELKL
jgi:hypothetical protein